MEVKRLLGSHGNTKQDPKELKVLHVFWRGAGGVKDIAICVEATLILGIGSLDEQLHYLSFQFLVYGCECECVNM